MGGIRIARESMQNTLKTMHGGAISTINALMLDPDTNEVLDFVGGRDGSKCGTYSRNWRCLRRAFSRETSCAWLRAVRLRRGV